jgi:hypothetical protein
MGCAVRAPRDVGLGETRHVLVADTLPPIVHRARRWERIAAMVDGKTKVQCFKRFKELKEAFKTKKENVEA